MIMCLLCGIDTSVLPYNRIFYHFFNPHPNPNPKPFILSQPQTQIQLQPQPHLYSTEKSFSHNFFKIWISEIKSKDSSIHVSGLLLIKLRNYHFIIILRCYWLVAYKFKHWPIILLICLLSLFGSEAWFIISTRSLLPLDFKPFKNQVV